MCVTWEGRAGRTYRHRLVSWTVNLDGIRSSPPLLRSWSSLLLPRPLSDSEPDCCCPTSSLMKDSPSCPLFLLLCPPTPTVVDLMGSASRRGTVGGGRSRDGDRPLLLADPVAPSLLDESGSGRASRVT